ncbi:hypothetical protein A2U01_0108388, partial [Trifolium medium]|nr:hypothetical protein [Trifolium medium]
CQIGGRPDALRPADLNRPGKIRETRAQEHQNNRKPRTCCNPDRGMSPTR